MPSGTLFKQHLNLQFVLCLCFCHGRLPIQQLEHQLQALRLILSNHLRTLCQDSVLEGGDEDLIMMVMLVAVIMVLGTDK